MKTKFISLIIFVSLAIAAQAQLYVNVQVGYAMPSSVAEFDLNDITASIDQEFNTTSYTETQVRSTTGGGILPALTIGYMINENLGVELTGAYLMGSTTTGTATVQTPFGDAVSMLERSTSQIRVSPTVVVKGSGETLKPYAKFGALIPVAGQTTSELTESELEIGSTGVDINQTKATLETQGKISVGFLGSFGAEYAVSDNIGIFGEIAFQSLSIQGKTTEVVSYTVNGQDVLSQLPASATMINYVDEITPASNNEEIGANFNPLEASEELRPISAYGNVGVNFGVSIKL